MSIILFMYKIGTYKVHLGVLNMSLCIYHVFGFFSVGFGLF